MSQRPHDRRRLSVAMIVRNAEDAVAETLASVRGLTDDIVVLDTGSTDQTPQIVQQQGAALHRAAWSASFAAARNHCLKHVHSEWVLWLDAGETIDRNETQLLREFLDEQADPTTAYTLRIAVAKADQHIGGEQIARLRLHPNRPGLAFEGRVRETLTASLAASQIQIEPLPIVIHRGKREHGQWLKQARATRNVQLADLQITELGPTAEMHNCLGEALQTLDETTRAKEHYELARSLAAPKSSELLEAYYGLLTCLDASVDNRAAQLQICMQAVAAFPLDAQLLCALGGYLHKLDHNQLSLRTYELALQHGYIDTSIWHLPEIREIAAACRCVMLQKLGRSAEAKQATAEARSQFPNSLRFGGGEKGQSEARSAINLRIDSAAMPLTVGTTVSKSSEKILHSAP